MGTETAGFQQDLKSTDANGFRKKKFAGAMSCRPGGEKGGGGVEKKR